MEDDENGNKVGYGKPPKHGRFKKGKSGNPKGRPPRPKPANDMRAMLERVANEEIEINGQMMSMAEVELRSIQRKAAKGDVAASRHLAKLRADAEVGQSQEGRGGVLVVPGTRPLEEWSISAAIQQAQFREQSEDDQ
ncbi:DUF5681 domain-containing protein [Parasphingorhabdus sp.]|uniref:DUF5681 domain-containing protein n=1 Tax=Parasphingorhabdus sp. TaxID=2709688 RepID=UPI0032EF6337